MKYKIKAQKKIEGEIFLPISKSVMNRFLTLCHLSQHELPDLNENWPNDVKLLHHVLFGNEKEKHVKDAGTAMRFVTAVLSAREGEWIIRGSERMHKRPIAHLVTALNALGADITYLGEEGFPPLLIKGRKLNGGKVSLPVDISSQYLSALLMIAPLCESKVEIECIGEKVSEPYIEMTINMMKDFGVNVEEENNIYFIDNQIYRYKKFDIELDWSSAAFIYEVCALSESCEILLPGLSFNSYQGDKECRQLFEILGVKSRATSEGIVIGKEEMMNSSMQISIDFTDIPDLVQAYSMTCLALGLSLKLEGLYNLHLKESNRLEAIKHNVEELGGKFIIDGSEAELIPAGKLNSVAKLRVFDDHRMAMALAPLALKIPEVIVPEVETVKKSFPDFWKELLSLVFDLTEMP